jgi:hypothetical protein
MFVAICNPVIKNRPHFYKMKNQEYWFYKIYLKHPQEKAKRNKILV